MNKLSQYIIALIFLSLVSCSQQKTDENNESKSSSQSSVDSPYEDQINDLISKMTVEEKVGQMTQLTLGCLTSSTDQHNGKVKEIDDAKLEEALLKYYVGSILNSAGNAYSTEKWHGIIKKVQDKALEAPNKIPVIYGIDAIHGTTYTKESTLFPHNVAMAASRNTDLVKQAAKITALETRASGIRWDFDPVLDAGRNPIWPRFPETFGEDAYLIEKMGVAAIQGYEEDGLDKTTAVASCMKHFVGYSDPASGKDRTEAYIPKIQLWEHYLPQFQAAIDAGAETIMINSASVNGVPVHGSYYYLTELLREKMGFKGMIVTDWEDIIRLHTRHKVSDSPREAVKLGIMSGIDMSMVPNNYSFCEHLISLVNDGEVPESRIDESVRRILRLKFKLGLFDNPYTEEEAIPNFGKKEFQQVALTAALESIVLLKNENGALPLSKADKVLIAGPTANNHATLNGSWSYSWQGKKEDEYPERNKTIAEAIIDKVGAENAISISENSFDNSANFDVQTLKNSAKNVDKIILCLGENAYAESPGVIDNLDLDDNQIELAMAAYATGKPVIIILSEGRPRIIRKIEPQTDGILLALQPGSMGGPAIADILFGDYNPNAALPFSYPMHSGDIIPYDHKYLSAIQQLTPGSITFNGYKPQYKFGHGLSYTTFEIDSIFVAKTVTKNQDFNVSVQVTNTGDRDGMKVIDLFISDHYASISPAVKKLKAFQKVNIKAGETTKVDFTLNSNDLSFVNENGEQILEEGMFSVIVGDSKTDFELQ